MAIIWHIKQCRHCPKHGDCEHKESLKLQSKTAPTVHVSHNCTEYKKLFRKGQRVEIDLYNRVPSEECEAEWEFHSTVEGVITGVIYRRYLWEVRLFKMVKLRRYNSRNTPSFTEVDFVNAAKPANKIKVLDGELSELPDIGRVADWW